MTIFVNGTSKGTKTDNEGEFALSSAVNSVLTFSFVGYQPQQMTAGAGGSRDYANAIANFYAEDIEITTVLKGPNAAARYGSRAAHGVVLI